MTTHTEIARVTCRWDDRPGVVPGWYCETYDAADQMVDDSQKVWFPVAVDDYRADEYADLRADLRAAFPGAEIIRC